MSLVKNKPLHFFCSDEVILLLRDVVLNVVEHLIKKENVNDLMMMMASASRLIAPPSFSETFGAARNLAGNTDLIVY